MPDGHLPDVPTSRLPSSDVTGSLWRTERQRIISRLNSVRDLAWHDLPITDMDSMLPVLIAEAKRDLLPAENSDSIVEAMISLAELKGVSMPKGPAFEVALMIMAGWPPDLFVLAFKRIIEHHVYPRLPYVAEFRAFIQDDLDERCAVLEGLEDWQRKVERRDRDEAARREAEWMQRGRVPPTQAERDAVAATLRQVHRHLTTEPASPAASRQPEQADPRSDHDAQDQADQPTR